jgi:hypothetical protein
MFVLFGNLSRLVPSFAGVEQYLLEVPNRMPSNDKIPGPGVPEPGILIGFLLTDPTPFLRVESHCPR